MSEVNWWVLAGLVLVAWVGQNVTHELAHLWTGWTWEGRKPLKLVPVPHRYQGQWYWARYECGPATRTASPRHRHIAPVRWAFAQAWTVVCAILLAWVFDAGTLVMYLVPFLACPVVDLLVWHWGLFTRRAGTDGARWRAQAQADGEL